MGRVSFKMGDGRLYRPLSGGAWHWWLSGWLLVCGLRGFCARHGLVGASLVHGQMLVG